MMMQITINYNDKYMEAIFEIDNTRVETGLLNAKEQVDLANELIEAARELAPELLERNE